MYKRQSEDNSRLLGAVLVGDVEDYGNLLQMMLNALPLPSHPDTLILPAYAGAKPTLGVDALPESAQICSCFDVSKGDIAKAVAEGHTTLAAIKQHTKAGTGCGGCVPLISQVLNAELVKQGIEVNNHLCAHFPHSRQELFHLVKVCLLYTSRHANSSPSSKPATARRKSPSPMPSWKGPTRRSPVPNWRWRMPA